MKPFLTCKEVADFLAGYLDRSLAPREQAEFDRHLAVCPPCIHYVEQYQTTVELGRTALRCDDDKLPAEVPEELIAAILAARKKPG